MKNSTALLALALLFRNLLPAQITPTVADWTPLTATGPAAQAANVVVNYAAIGQSTVYAGCTPESMKAQKAGSLAALEIGRWDCYGVNAGPKPAPFSLGLFALNFPELHMLAATRVKDVLTVKQGHHWTSTTVKVISYALMIATAITGAGAPVVSARVVSRLAVGAVIGHQASDEITKEIPSLVPFTGDLLSAQFATLGAYSEPGYWVQFTVYASKTPLGTQALGPRWVLIPPPPAPPAPPTPPLTTEPRANRDAPSKDGPMDVPGLFPARPLPPPGTNPPPAKR